MNPNIFYACRLLPAGLLLGLLFDSEGGGTTFLKKVGEILVVHMALPPQKELVFNTIEHREKMASITSSFSVFLDVTMHDSQNCP
jgi:hypothetical protein